MRTEKEIRHKIWQTEDAKGEFCEGMHWALKWVMEELE